MKVFYTFRAKIFFLFSFLDSETFWYIKPRSLFSKFHHFSYLGNIFLQKMQMEVLSDSEANKAVYVFWYFS
jgi:hypothetical protein